jgi:sec-independent protein translocase protein TatB
VFDISFTELMFIGMVALVVIGPEKLPKVARTVGHLLGRAQRYVSDVKGDIQREVELDELRKMKDEMESAAQSMKSSFSQTEADIKKELDTSTEALSALESEFKADYEPSVKEPASKEPTIQEPAPAEKADDSENENESGPVAGQTVGLPPAKSESGLDDVPPSGATVKETPAPSNPKSSPSGVESKT